MNGSSMNDGAMNASAMNDGAMNDGAMSGKRAAPRRGVVLGAGGVLGASWMIGALRALHDVEGVDPRQAEVLVGTSAGSVLAGLLAAGVGVDTLVNHQRGVLVEGDPRLHYDYDGDTAVPPRPRLGIGSRSLLARSARHPRQVPTLAPLYALLPAGRASIGRVGDVVRAARGGSDSWPRRPACWVTAMDYDTGRRVVFGRAGAPRPGLPAAVMASCAIPGWYAPIVIDGRRYVDGGTCSATSLDLLAGRGLDEVYVLSPMASVAPDQPTSVMARVERRWRRRVTRLLHRDVERVRAGGTNVTLLTPGPEDLAAIGANLMNPGRRDHVLETALRTTTAVLREGAAGRFADTG